MSNASDLVLLRANDLAAIRGHRVLFQNLSFELRKGKFANLSGPNGSGKTTLLRILAGLATPDKGDVKGPSEEPVQMGWLGHDAGFRRDETPESHLAFWRGYCGARKTDIEACLERVGLLRQKALSTYRLSAGQKKRIALARLLMSPAKIWLLDEPASALDEAGKALLVELIEDHCKKGGSVIAALHEALPIETDQHISLAKAV